MIMDDLTFDEADKDQGILDLIKSDLEECRKKLIEHSKKLTRDAGFEKSINNYFYDLLGDTVEWYEMYTEESFCREEDQHIREEQEMYYFRQI